MFFLKAERMKEFHSGIQLGAGQRMGVNDPSDRKCALVDAGRISYGFGLELQKKARKLVENGEWDGLILLLEHEPVITIGRNGGLENLLLEEPIINSKGVKLFKAERGGNITAHNPGQLVIYPIMNLKKWKQDVHWYVRTIEDLIIKLLANYQVIAERKAGYTGVWINNEKIAAIGIFISRWVTSHGLALNVNNDLNIFKFIIPCGNSSYGVTSLSQSGVHFELNELKRSLLSEFEKAFECVLNEKIEVPGLFN